MHDDPSDPGGAPRRRGRPRGLTDQGRQVRDRLYRTALALVAERGYERATLRDVARRAGVSPALLYRYFPSKRAVVLALYDELSAELAARAGVLPRGRWPARAAAALEASLDVLRPHRAALRALVPVLVGAEGEGLLAPGTSFSRVRVEGVFVDAVRGASDAPPGEAAEALGRLLYVAHLAVVLGWLLDRSPGQAATDRLVALAARALPPAALALRLRRGRALVVAADALLREALLPPG